MFQLEDYPYNEEQLAKRLAGLSTQEMSYMDEQAAYRYILSSIDLTTLEGSDNRQTVVALCKKAQAFYNPQRQVPSTAAGAGALMAFLLFNAYPARIFMGDTGALALGGVIAMEALVSKSPLLLPLMGVCFVLSALSVMIQVGSYKLRNGKRVFKMAPLHHHFELMGVSEPRITATYMLLTGVCCALSIYIFTK